MSPKLSAVRSIVVGTEWCSTWNRASHREGAWLGGDRDQVLPRPAWVRLPAVSGGGEQYSP